MSNWCAQPLAVSRRSVAITNDWRNPVRSKTTICSRLVATPYMTTDVVWYLVWALSSLCMCCPTLPGPLSAVSLCNMLLQLMMLLPVGLQASGNLSFCVLWLWCQPGPNRECKDARNNEHYNIEYYNRESVSKLLLKWTILTVSHRLLRAPSGTSGWSKT